MQFNIYLELCKNFIILISYGLSIFEQGTKLSQNCQNLFNKIKITKGHVKPCNEQSLNGGKGFGATLV